jgi:hypothetical protein
MPSLSLTQRDRIPPQISCPSASLEILNNNSQSFQEPCKKGAKIPLLRIPTSWAIPRSTINSNLKEKTPISGDFL